MAGRPPHAAAVQKRFQVFSSTFATMAAPPPLAENQFQYAVRAHFGDFLRQCHEVKEQRTEFTALRDFGDLTVKRFVERLVAYGYECEQNKQDPWKIKFKISFTATAYPPTLAEKMAKVHFDPNYSDEKERSKSKFWQRTSPYKVQACHTCEERFEPFADFSYPRGFDPEKVIDFQGSDCATTAVYTEYAWKLWSHYGSRFDDTVFDVLDETALRLPCDHANYCDACIQGFLEKKCIAANEMM